MKYTLAKRQECAEWISEHGLYPQQCGASIKEYCAAMGINVDTHFEWLKTKPEYPELIKTANESFRTRIVGQTVNSLARLATGYSDVKMEEYGQYMKSEKTLEDGTVISVDEWKTVKAKRIKTNVAPNVAAAIFLLTNLDSEHWKNKQDTNLSGSVKGMRIVVSDDETADDLKEVIDGLGEE